VAVGPNSNSRSLVEGSHYVLEKAMNLWHDLILGGEDIPKAFDRGRTFVGCTSPQGILTKNIKHTAKIAEVAKIVAAINRVNRNEGRIALEKHQILYYNLRGL
jgi:hypothetical protein